MRTLTNLLISLIIAAWLGAIAVFSIQNIQPISLQFLVFNSIELPLGVLLALSVGVGLVIGAGVPLFFRKSNRRRSVETDFAE